MDSLTTHYLARELDARWRGRRVLAGALTSEPPRVTLHVEGTDSIGFDLTAEPFARWSDPPEDTSRLTGWTVSGVTAPIDERRLVVHLERRGKFRGSPTRSATLEVSLHPTMRGALLRDSGGGILGAIGSKLPRAIVPRPELADEEIARAAEAGDPDALLRGRWMSGPLVTWLIGDPARAVERHRVICALPPAQPSMCGERVVPLPLCAGAHRLESLVLPAVVPGTAPESAAPTTRQRALLRMRRELERARQAPRWREAAERLLLLGDAPAPPVLTLSDGSAFAVDARPGESALRTGERLHKDARSLERAAERLPERIAALERAPASAASEARAPRPRRAGKSAAALPYRVYRSTGGIEILVGRGATSNDTLTFKVAAAEDVWLHARESAGAHVVLRWARPEPPPRRDLEEAAALAAWHSKSRGSSVVPVDWTRRKYVRRPRGGPAGVALVSRSDTIMVRADAELERKLRANASSGALPNE